MKQAPSVVVLVGLFFSPMLFAQHYPSNADLRQFRGVSSPHLSPDGSRVLTELQNSTDNGGKTHLWLLNVNGSPFSQITFPGFASSSQKNSQFLDDHTIIFTSGGKLYRLDLSRPEEKPIEIMVLRTPGDADSLQEIDSYFVAPDGKTIAVITNDPDSPEKAKEDKELRDFTWVNHDEPNNHIYLIHTGDWTTTEVPRLSAIDDLSWSAASDRLLVLTHTRPADFGYSTAVWIVPTQIPGSQEKVPNIPETTFRAAWLHSGEGFVLFAQCQEDAPIGSSDLYTFDLRSKKLKHLDAGVKDGTLSARMLIVSADDRSVLVSVTHGVVWTVGRVSLDSGRMEYLNLGMPVITDFVQGPANQSAGVYIGSSSISAPSVYISSSLGLEAKRLVQPATVPTEWKAASSQIVSWKRAGLTLEGLLYLPPNASAIHRAPLVVLVHGGPSGQFTDTYTPLINLLVGQGWAVFAPNPRGSTGYGVAFEAANKADLGNGDFLDVMAGVDEMLRAYPTDPRRTALMGYSYGGQLAAFVEGKTDRFKAIVSGAPVSDAVSEAGTSEDPYPDTWFTGKPWRDHELAWRQSPLAYAANAKTPFLLLQGENDSVDPPDQAKELYRALRMEGVSVDLLLFPRETHSSLRRQFYGEPSTEPWHGVIVRQRMLDFIAKAFSGMEQ